MYVLRHVGSKRNDQILNIAALINDLHPTVVSIIMYHGFCGILIFKIARATVASYSVGNLTKLIVMRQEIKIKKPGSFCEMIRYSQSDMYASGNKVVTLTCVLMAPK